MIARGGAGPRGNAHRSKVDGYLLSACGERLLARFEYGKDVERELAVRHRRPAFANAAEKVGDRRSERLFGGDAFEIALRKKFRSDRVGVGAAARGGAGRVLVER